MTHTVTAAGQNSDTSAKAPPLPSDLRFEMQLTYRFGEEQRRYWCEGALGAVEFQVRKASQRVLEIDPSHEFYGGFEVHTATPRRGAGPPSHGQCEALSGRACWHDGSSTYATESWIPRWRMDPDNHEAIFRRLASEYRERFESEEAGR